MSPTGEIRLERVFDAAPEEREPAVVLWEAWWKVKSGEG